MEKEELERICFNCNQFYPATMDEATEYGICLSNSAFEPYLDELLENQNYNCCRELIEDKKFLGDRSACENFEELEMIEIDDDSPLGRELNKLKQEGKLNEKSLKKIFYDELDNFIDNIDWKNAPIDKYVNKLESTNKKECNEGISSLSSLITLGNNEAFKVLCNFFKDLSPPKSIEEVHFKINLLRHLEKSDNKIVLIPHLIEELQNTISNNTTKQWISAILKFLQFCPKEKVYKPLEQLLNDKRFSYRLKNKIKDVLNSKLR
ncbi:MAG: hypothetical protein HQK79_21750 [Desulfobacterales bacterium]|nr:hypothetical protein [Desulfobacterales bacterium]MBF0397680.1 hypothetical protein [Desulfobacterales bacterium]